MSPRLKVLCALISTVSLPVLAARAQPPDAANTQNGAEQPLLPITLAEWDKHNGVPTALTLKIENATASDIAAEVEKQTGIVLIVPEGRLLGNGGAVPRFSVEATGQPFWQAVRQWNRGESKLKVMIDRADPNRWMLTDENFILVRPTTQQSITTGPCELFLNSVSFNMNRSLRFDGVVPAQNNQAKLSFQGTLQLDPLDPRWPVTLAGMIPEIDSAVDDRERAVAVNPNDVSVSSSGDTSINFGLKEPEANATKLSSLKGRLRLAVVMKRQKWEIDLKATPQPANIFQSDGEEVTYIFDTIITHNNSSTVKLLVTRRPIGANPHRVFKVNGQWSPLGDFSQTTRSIHVFDGAGNLMIQGGGSGQRPDETTLNLDMRFNVNPNTPPEQAAPAKILIDVPLEYRELQIPFEFKDVPLP